MDSNTYSAQPPQPAEPPGRSEPSAGGSGPLGWLTAADQELAAEHLDRLTDAALDEELLALRRRLDRLEGQWLAPTLDGMVAVDGLLEPEAGQLVQTALEPLARPAAADDRRLGGQRTADALTELCRRALEGGRLPTTGGVRPQLLVTVGLDSLLGRPGGIGGVLGWAGALDAEACRRLACDGNVTRVLVGRQPHPDGDKPHPDHHHGGDPGPDHGPASDHYPSSEPTADSPGADLDPGDPTELQGRLRAAMALLPPTLGGAPCQPLDLGRATRVVSPAQRSALAVRDRGCMFPDCDRPLAWCEAHHLWHWVDGPTDLWNLALVCRAHHRTVHEGAGTWPEAPTAGSRPPPARRPATGDNLVPRPPDPAGTSVPGCGGWVRPPTATTVPGS